MTDLTHTPSREGGAYPRVGLIFRSLFRADFTVLVRSTQTVILNIAVPILYLVITDLHNLLHLGGNAPAGWTAEFTISLALTVGLMSASVMGYAGTVAQDRATGVFQRLRVTPAPTWAIMGSRLLVQVVVDLIMTVIVLIIGSAMHSVLFATGQYLLVVGVSLLGGAMFLAIAQAIAGIVRSAAGVNAVGRVLFIVFLLLGLLGASGILGDTVQEISDWTPVGALINVYSGVLDTAGWDWTNTSGLITTVGYIVVGAFIGIRWFRWESR
ncbi:MAG: ABC transporter permease [Humibacter sp.]